MKKGIFAIVTIIALVVTLLFFEKLVTPKYVTVNKEGALIREYYTANHENDVIFLGDCEVYANISPVELFEVYGITSYIRGSANQTVWQSYYLLSEMLKVEKPQAVVFNVLAMKYDEPVKEEYNRLTLDGMRLSGDKLKAIDASMCKGESKLSYIFPIIRYHERIGCLTAEDAKYIFNKPNVAYNGFLMRKDVKPYTALPSKMPLPDYTFSKSCYDYLDKMRVLCEKNGVTFVLMKAPTLYPYWYDEWDKAMAAYADEHGLKYINTLSALSDIGIDFTKDTYDGGLHLNVHGAKKLTDYLGKWLTDNGIVSVTDKSDKCITYWKDLSERYYKELNE